MEFPGKLNRDETNHENSGWAENPHHPLSAFRI